MFKTRERIDAPKVGTENRAKGLLSEQARQLIQRTKALTKSDPKDMDAMRRLRDEMNQVLLDSSAPCLMFETMRWGRAFGEQHGREEPRDLLHALRECWTYLNKRIEDMERGR